MPDTIRPALVISDGGLAALLAMWTEGVCRRPPTAVSGPLPHVAWRPIGLSVAAWAAIDRAVEICQFSRVIDGPLGEGASMPVPTGLAAMERGSGGDKGSDGWSHLLLCAAEAAIELGLSRVIWPVQLGQPRLGASDAANGLEEVAKAHDRALLVARLASLDAPPSSGGLVIETPYLAMSDDQIADLAADLDAPISAAWWCIADGAGSEESEPCGRCMPCRRWHGALQEAGVLATMKQ